MQERSIAIDGPAGAGKSTLARALARELGYLYVDTGAIYRTVALRAREAGADPSDPEQVAPLLEDLDLRMDYGGDGVQRMYLSGRDVTETIRENEVSALASQVAALPAVREFLLDFQRKQAREHNVVMDGRDIGTVVLPQAGVKIFLTAAPEARARRRTAELLQRGQDANFDEILREIRQRDEQDENRPVAPLRQAEDAALLDTTNLDLKGSLEALLTLVRERLSL
ncbi:(d)CMP kinase [Pseudoflavonifractor capillosus]|uniref:(d)CMP kinase n=1 Tax=Pseudoflavonifractor capillosus TaxID=106588 RepID=UPI0019586496|nr:(d)CMP kinase [Pseudoflavonifractor capillosus]MBM6680192.1 (d)CMP kinase [Pseudoflavonifractor capillosus]